MTNAVFVASSVEVLALLSDFDKVVKAFVELHISSFKLFVRDRI
jgi:hypothetical protein